MNEDMKDELWPSTWLLFGIGTFPGSKLPVLVVLLKVLVVRSDCPREACPMGQANRGYFTLHMFLLSIWCVCHTLASLTQS